jgi:hypothetical protein
MRSETCFKSKKKVYSFIQHRKNITRATSNSKKKSSLTSLLSAEEEELDEEERDEERRGFLPSLFLTLLLGLDWLLFLLTPP